MNKDRVEDELSGLRDEIIHNQLSSLSDLDAINLIKAIKSYLINGEDVPLNSSVDYQLEYFKISSNTFKSIFLLIFKCAKEDNQEICALLEEVEFLFEKKHIMEIFTEVNNMSEDFQKIWYDNIYNDIAPRYEYLLEKHGLSRKK